MCLVIQNRGNTDDLIRSDDVFEGGRSLRYGNLVEVEEVLLEVVLVLRRPLTRAIEELVVCCSKLQSVERKHSSGARIGYEFSRLFRRTSCDAVVSRRWAVRKRQVVMSSRTQKMVSIFGK